MLNQSRDPINYGQVRTTASLTARTVESFDHQEKYFSPYRRTITSYFKYISIADLRSDLWFDKKKIHYLLFIIYLNGNLSEASVIDSKYITMTGLQDFN